MSLMFSKKTKYKNKIQTIENIKFHSRKEASRYTDLKIMERMNLIKDLRLQVSYKFPIKYDSNRAITYIADFVYYDLQEKKEIVEDVKGFKTDVYKIKKALMQHFYEITIKEI